MIVDSDILINASRGSVSAVEFLIHAGNTETLYVSVISHLELQAGARDKVEMRRIEKFLARFELALIDAAICKRAIALMRQYRLSHGLTLPDALIANTAIESKESLATSNIRDFTFISGLQLATL